MSSTKSKKTPLLSYFTVKCKEVVARVGKTGNSNTGGIRNRLREFGRADPRILEKLKNENTGTDLIGQ